MPCKGKNPGQPSPEENMDAINVSAEETDRVGSLGGYVLETEKVIWHLRRPSHLTGPV